MKSTTMKIFAMTCLGATIAMTGCATKHRKTSEVVVSPMGVNGGGAGYYNGGALVNNSADVVAMAGQKANAVYFGFDSSEIDSQGQAVLNQHASLLKAKPDARVQISGHTDERGSREYNMALGERRAKSAQAYLGSQGIDASRTEAVSYGEDQPAAAGHDESSWALNRRAELNY
ncbi:MULTISPECIES: peptidoglycan-associated lipoprotein Pal [unclassified Moraxella]|uniref:peptidoglycan-associated lipoprotein Pal n=1 Tax=unclassified Moraxella TaxID=2685852 RepID=UPI003AF9EDEB